MPSKEDLLSRIAGAYSRFAPVEAVVLSGSETSESADPHSDLDFYVYLNAELSVANRNQIAHQFSPSPEVGNVFFEPGDEWIDQQTGIAVDVMFRFKQWIESQLTRILDEHQASVGYSTCFWHNVLSSRLLFDRNGWFAALLHRCEQPYPEALRRAILNKNYPILRNTQSSFLHQLERAIARNDVVSIQHRITALLASYFDVLFAYNRVPHPGEKRLILFAESRCQQIPPGMNEQIQKLLVAARQDILQDANALIDGLELLLKE